jgi:molecular chaperone HscB
MSDYFEVLGLPRRFAVDPAELERNYLERSRAVHPDRLAGEGRSGGSEAAGQAMEVNQAYRTLRRDLSRAEHLLSLQGVTIGDNQPVAPALLAEVLELREELEAARAAGDRGGLSRLEGAARARERAELGQLADLFTALEAASAAEGSARRNAVVDQVIRLRYLARYREAFADDDEDAA